jgi:hypothetical protein
VARQHPQDRSQHRAGILLGGAAHRAGAHHGLRLAEQALDVEAHQGRRRHSEVGQSRVAPADRRHAVEHVTEAVGPGNVFELRARIRDRDEAVAALGGANGIPHPLEEVLLEDVRLERRAGLRGHDA